MKLPKKVNRLCPYCHKQTEQKVVLVSTGHKRGSLKRGSKIRAMLRGRARGFGNMGRWSKPAVGSWKRKTKATKRLVVMYTCAVCKKSKSARSRRVSKIVFDQ